MARIRNRYTYVEEGTEGGETFQRDHSLYCLLLYEFFLCPSAGHQTCT